MSTIEITVGTEVETFELVKLRSTKAPAYELRRTTHAPFTVIGRFLGTVHAERFIELVLVPELLNVQKMVRGLKGEPEPQVEHGVATPGSAITVTGDEYVDSMFNRVYEASGFTSIANLAVALDQAYHVIPSATYAELLGGIDALRNELDTELRLAR